MKIKIKDYEIELKAKYINEVEKWNYWRNWFRVYVKNLNNKQYTFFSFFDAPIRINKKELKGQALLEAFECFLLDCLAGGYSLKEFMAEFGYKNEKEAEKIWEACRKQKEKFEKLFPGENLNEFIEKLRAVYLE